MINRDQLPKSKRLVVKIGSSMVTADGAGIDRSHLADWAEQIARLKQKGIDVLLVSSGAVSEGMSRLGWSSRPKALHHLQAAAAVGQMGVIQAYAHTFRSHQINTAQILLTHDDLSNRKRYLNARSTINALLSMGVLPIINENDSVATEEIQFGDNDTLAALVANLVQADTLAILTDQAGLYERNPSEHSDAKLISHTQSNDPLLDKMVESSAGKLGTGGMKTKLKAARLAARSGTATIIASGHEPDILNRLIEGEAIGTFLAPTSEPLDARKQWLAGQLQPKGTVMLDEGAVTVIKSGGCSLLAVGVIGVTGTFIRGELVECLNQQHQTIARGLINYSAQETHRIKGKPSDRIEEELGYIDEDELIHRDNMVVY